MIYYLGADPGVHGALALITETRAVQAVERMPEEPTALMDMLLRWNRWMMAADSIRAAMELVTGYIPSRGHAKSGEEFKHGGQPGHSMFQFGRNVGLLEMALLAAGHNPLRPTANVWQRALGLRTRIKGETDSRWKGYLWQEAMNRFRVKIYKPTADALLIAEYALLQDKGG